ncbi:MAG: polymer-forming cytoskeletal protein [Holophagaceae bacterium]|nr:polymer-forming cytoskeletal protein [Holophagaceae bacterium]
MFNKSSNTTDNKKETSAQQPAFVNEESTVSPSSNSYRHSGLEITSSKPSIISEEVELTGNIKTPGALHIEGTVKGNLDVASLTIGPTGVFEGNVNCKSLNVRGKFTGTSDCKELMVASSAQIEAKITYRELTLQRGAILKGELHVAND